MTETGQAEDQPPSDRNGTSGSGRPGDERPGLAWAFATFFFLLASYYVLRPLRDERAVAGGVEHIPWLFTATLLGMLLAVPLWSALAARVDSRRLIGLVYRFFVFNLLAFFLLFRLPDWQTGAARAFFVWISVFNMFVVSAFWSFMTDAFSHRQGKRWFGVVTAGGSAGAIVGPLLTSLLVSRIGPVNLILLAALLLELASRAARGLGAWSRRNPPNAPSPPALADRGADAAGAAARGGVGGSAWSAVRLLLSSSYLTGIAGYVVLMTTISTFGYMIQARLVAGQGLTPVARTALFAHIDLAVNVASAAVQAFLVGPALVRVGVTPALLLSPALAVAGSLALGAVPRLGVIVANQVVRRVGEYAVSRPAREVLFTLATREEKYKPKSLIDTVVYRSGDALGSWLFTALAGTGVGLSELALWGIPVAILWLGVGWWLGRRHARISQRGVPTQARTEI